MKIVQVSCAHIDAQNVSSDIYRISLCDDGNYGKHHFSARIKPIKNLTLAELAESFNDPKYGFVRITENEGVENDG